MSAARSKVSAQNSKKTVGKPFKKGISGNPGGRPKTPEWFKEKSAIAQAKILELMSCGDEKVEFQAAALILAYSFGKPTEHVEMNVVVDGAKILRERREKLKRS